MKYRIRPNADGQKEIEWFEGNEEEFSQLKKYVERLNAKQKSMEAI